MQKTDSKVERKVVGGVVFFTCESEREYACPYKGTPPEECPCRDSEGFCRRVSYELVNPFEVGE